MIKIEDFIAESEGVNSSMVSKSGVEFISSMINIDTDKARGVPVTAYGASVKMRDVGGYVMLDLKFSSSTSAEKSIIFNYLEKYGKDLNELNEESKFIPETAFIITTPKYSQHYILLANPIFWSLHSSNKVGDYDTIRVLFEEASVGFFKEEK